MRRHTSTLSLQDNLLLLRHSSAVAPPSTMAAPEEDSGFMQRLRARGEETLLRARDLLRTCDWRLVAEGRNSGDNVQWTTVPGMGRILLLSATYNCQADKLWTALCGDVERFPKWCKIFSSARVLKTVDSQTDVLYHETHAAGGGLVSPRDWVTLRHWEREHDWFQQAAVGIDYPIRDRKKNMVRGDTVISLYSVSTLPSPEAQGTATETPEGTASGDGARCRLQFMTCCNMGGWLPMKVIERFYVASCLSLAADLRQRVEK